MPARQWTKDDRRLLRTVMRALRRALRERVGHGELLKLDGDGEDDDGNDDDDEDSGAVQDVPLWERMADDAMDSIRARL